ncbi:MAG: hypothetical protein IJU34_05550, partial [Bacteroidales bacterium]|nr:hypothetical protein [Bacteroidales bacterium]
MLRSLPLGRPGPGPGVRLPNAQAPVFVGVWEPVVSQPLRRQSPSPLPHQTASGASLRFAPAP